MLKAIGLKKSFGARSAKQQVLDGIDLHLNAGARAILLGRSGSGKSTLLNCLGLIESLDSGTIELNEVRVDALSDKQQTNVRLQQIGFVFQSFHLIPVLTVEENIALPAIIAGQTPQKAQARSKELAEQVGLGFQRSQPVSQLSGGQKQRVAIARALVNHPKLILADEPTANLDEENSQQIMRLLSELCAQDRRLLIVSTHDASWLKYGTQKLTMSEGRLQCV